MLQWVTLILYVKYLKKASCFSPCESSSLTSVFMRWCCNCFQHDIITTHLLSLRTWHGPADLNRSRSVCVCVVFCEHIVCVAGSRGTSDQCGFPERARLFRTVWVWNGYVLYCIMSGVIAPWGTSGIRAAYDFMETPSDNGRLVCVDLNRSG